MIDRIVCECGIDCGPSLAAELKAEQERHEFTCTKWFRERKELTDELVTLRAEARRALWWIDQAAQGETWRNWDDVRNGRDILRALFKK